MRVADTDAVKRALMGTRGYLRLRDLVVRAHRTNQWVAREDLARRYLAGDGIEVGALTKPLRLPPGARARQVDYKSREDLLREDGPELAERGLDPSRIPAIDVVDDAQHLHAFADASLDFVVSNHVLEHLEDPIEGLENALRVLKPGGILLLTLPHARHTFDAARERTTVEHLVRDHREGPQVSREAHYAEWATSIEGRTGADVATRAAEYAAEDARHHFHVWDLETFLPVLAVLDRPHELLEARAVGIEFTVVLRRPTS